MQLQEQDTPSNLTRLSYYFYPSGPYNFRLAPRHDVQMLLPSGLNVACITLVSCDRVLRHTPESIAHKLMVFPPYDVDRTTLPSGLKATNEITSRCPVKVLTQVPDSASQILTVKSSDPVTMRVPSALNAAAVTDLE